MPQTLAQKVRAKYPGAYDDLSDTQLESAVLAKHPEYADLPRSSDKPAAGPKPIDPNEPDTFAGGFARSLGQTAYDTGRGILSGAASLLDPRTYGALVTSKDAADKALGTQRATMPVPDQLRQLGSQISDPYEGGKLIGQLAGGELLPRAASAMAPKVGPGLAAAGRRVERGGEFLRKPADWAAAAEVIHGGPAGIPAAVATAATPRVIAATGRGAQKLGALLTKAPEVRPYLPNKPGIPDAGVDTAVADSSLAAPEIDHSFSVKNAGASSAPPTATAESAAAGQSAGRPSSGPSAHSIAERENIDNGSHFGLGHILPDPPAARPSELRDAFVEGNPREDTPGGMSAMTKRYVQDALQRTLDEQAALRGTPADIPDNPAARALEAERQAASAPQERPAKVPLAEARLASKSKRGGASGTPGLTVNDMQELGVDPSVKITAIAPDAIELLKRRRAERSAMYRALAELDKTPQ